jgi:hypothetical protein
MAVPVPPPHCERVAVEARVALAARRDRADDHALADLVAGHARAQLRDDADRLVTDDQPRLHRVLALQDVDVRAADRRRRDRTSASPGADLRHRPLLQLDAAGPTNTAAFIVFIWVGVFNVMVIAQFWAFAADLFNIKTGQRLFAVIMVGAALGALSGSQVAGRLYDVVGAASLMLLSAVLLGAVLVLSRHAERAVPEGRAPRARTSRGTAGQRHLAGAGRLRHRCCAAATCCGSRCSSCCSTW